MNTTWHTCTFIDLNLHIDGEHFAPLLPGLLTQLHRMEVNDLRRLRQSEYEGFVARKRETMIISMLSTLEMMVDFSMRETLDGRVLFFATFFGVDFKGIEKPFCCPFCRQVTEVDLCSLHKKKVYDNKCKEGRSRYNLRESTTKIRGGESKKVCDMIGCENSVEFMPSLTCSLKCTPTFCYECVWKCVTNKQDLLPVMLSEWTGMKKTTHRHYKCWQHKLIVSIDVRARMSDAWKWILQTFPVWVKVKTTRKLFNKVHIRPMHI